MNEEAISRQFTELRNKARQLSEAYHITLLEKERLAAEVETLKQELDLQKEALSHFQNQNKLSKLAATLGQDEKRELSRQINRFIKEIDTCIDLLANT